MSRVQIAANYTRILAQWPKDVLRPETNFSKVLEKRVQTPPIPFRDEEKEIKAAQLLLGNRFSNQTKLPQSLLRPYSNPQHYDVLKRELEEMPNRTWLQNFLKRLQNMVRFQ
ncbi:uncharacterized protein K489DRAFT_407551 [Dissoconium aciculare CBS 342.82]|uniref:Uncharacterized protein n=1 Tax=Dissoconium aciculare CBS 342.82 TaxID=1314786 RepID=A0A6J3M9T0_9PEZI|nr:uncharacterized protein K489DRAFT_407551 [Dissoconium aciculare CBS 342.82]KAF1824801.1 hypothetical protein K489DRAFT_407551 [Dissoconium aciculare CBS 342.82]